MDNLIPPQRNHCVSPAIVVAEFDFKNVIGELLDQGANLARHKAMLRQIFEERYHVQDLKFFSHVRDCIILRSMKSTLGILLLGGRSNWF